MSTSVRENANQHRFELPIADGAIAAAYYRIEGGLIVLVHTEVPAEFSGQGIASRLAQGTFGILRKTGRKAVLKCPFMGRYFEKHPEYADIVAG
ncbi:MAG: GNAT family N-acetyltransferase [Rhizobiaceae bacterium]|jgi:predicted GNAT family acetyltransferase